MFMGFGTSRKLAGLIIIFNTIVFLIIAINYIDKKDRPTIEIFYCVGFALFLLFFGFLIFLNGSKDEKEDLKERILKRQEVLELEKN